MPLSPGSTLDVHVTNTLTGTKVVDGVTYLVITSDLTGSVANLAVTTAPTGNQQASPIGISMTLTGKSTTLFDPNAGETRDTTFTMTTDVTMSGTGRMQPRCK